MVSSQQNAENKPASNSGTKVNSDHFSVLNFDHFSVQVAVANLYEELKTEPDVQTYEIIKQDRM